MATLSEVAAFRSGTPQFRINEDWGADAPSYRLYGQTDLEEDLKGLPSPATEHRLVRTFDDVCTTSAGEVVFSLLSGTAAIIHVEREGLLLTQNYVAISPSVELDRQYLLCLLNEHPFMRRQLRIGQQGSVIGKYSLSQLRSLELPPLPSQKTQQLIGELYCNQLKLEALRKHAAELETALVLGTIKEVVNHE